MYTLTAMTAASSEPLTAGLVNAIISGNQSEVNSFTNMIFARNDIRQNVQLTNAVAEIASGIHFNGVAASRGSEGIV